MSLENKIEELIKVIELNTEALNRQVEKPQIDVEDVAAPLIEVNVVKNLAKELIKQGTDKKNIKVMITELGADSISELSSTKLEILYNKLNEM